MIKRWSAQISGALRSRLVNALKVIAPILILLYLLKMVSEPIQKALGAAAVCLGGWVAIPPSVAGSQLACLVLAGLLLLAIGHTFSGKRGRRIIIFIDEAACKFALYKAVRNIVKLPKPSVATPGDPSPDAESEVVWFFSSGAWAVVPVKERWLHPEDGSKWLSVTIPSVPMPTGWSVRQIKASWTAPAGLNWGAWMFWQARAGGLLPDGAIPPPLQPPAEFRHVLAASTT